MRKTIQDTRIKAEPEIIPEPDMKTIINHSAGSSMVFLPFRLHRDRIAGPVEMPFEELVQGLPVVALVLAAEDIDLEAEPEEGKAGEAAATLDALADAEKKAAKAEKEAKTAAEEAEKRMKNIETGLESNDPEDLEDKIKAGTEAKAKAEKLARKAAKAKAKAEEAEKEAEDLGIKTPMAEKEDEKD